MCIILKLDLRCCRGCREWMCRNLKRVDGVEQVTVGDDEATIVVCGEGFDEAEIVRQVKKRKGRSEVEVMSRILHDAKPPPQIDAGARPADAPKPMPMPMPIPKPKVFDGEEEEQQQSSSPKKGETLVTERVFKEFQGTKIRTRVTTSQDACTCIRLEETHFIINKHRHHHTSKVHVNTYESPNLQISDLS